jgi:hypothetical protein
MRSTADLEDRSDKHPVTPGAVLPPRELLAELLMELDRPALAANEFETVLRSSPGRFNAIYGAARAAELTGKSKQGQAALFPTRSALWRRRCHEDRSSDRESILAAVVTAYTGRSKLSRRASL